MVSKKTSKLIPDMLIAGIGIRLVIYLISQYIVGIPFVAKGIKAISTTSCWKDFTGGIEPFISNPIVKTIQEKALWFFGIPAVLVLLFFVLFRKPLTALFCKVLKGLNFCIVRVGKEFPKGRRKIQRLKIFNDTNRFSGQRVYVRLIYPGKTSTEKLLDVTWGRVTEGNFSFEKGNLLRKDDPEVVYVYKNDAQVKTITKGNDWVGLDGVQIKVI